MATPRPQVSGRRIRRPRIRAVLAAAAVFSAVLIGTAAPASAATAGPAGPGTAASVVGPGSQAWSNPNDAKTSTHVYAYSGLVSSTSAYLQLTNFGLSVPAGATINGVSVDVERSASAASGDVRDASVKLVKASAVSGTEHAAGAVEWPTSDALASYGSTSDLWGTTLTQADVTSAGFGVAIAATNLTSGASFAKVDAVTITVTYTTGGGGGSVPVNTAPPTISGTPTVGVALASSPGTWTQSPTSYAYQWQACSPSCANISGATSPSYTPVAGDVGKTLKVQVIASNASGASAPALSAATAAVVTGGGGPPSGSAYTATFLGQQFVAGVGGTTGTAWVGEWTDAAGNLWISYVESSGPITGMPAWAANRYPSPLPSYVTAKDIWGATNSRQYMMSSDNGATWTVQFPRGGSTPDSLVTPLDGALTPNTTTSCSQFDQPGLGLPSGSGCPAAFQVPFSAQADIARTDGTIVRRVNGEDLAYNLGTQRTAYLQSFRPGVDTAWSAPQYLLDPATYTYQLSRINKLSDGRWIALGEVWDAPAGTRTGSTPVHHLLMVSSNEGVTWSAGNALQAPSGVTLPPLVNEWDADMLPNGDLIAVFRVTTGQRPWQAVLAADGSGGWNWTNAAQSPMPYTGHPEVLVTAEGAVLYIGSRSTTPASGPWGAWSMTSADAAAGLNNWQLVQFVGSAAAGATGSGLGCQVISGQSYYSCYAHYYPTAEQASNGDIVIVSWYGPGDAAYPPPGDQRIVINRFRLNP